MRAHLTSYLLRGLQILCGFAVLALSGIVISWQRVDDIPKTISVSAGAGVFCVLVSLVGFTSGWRYSLPEMAVSCLDGLAAVWFVGSAVVSVVLLRLERRVLGQ